MKSLRLFGFLSIVAICAPNGRADNPCDECQCYWCGPPTTNNCVSKSWGCECFTVNCSPGFFKSNFTPFNPSDPRVGVANCVVEGCSSVCYSSSSMVCGFVENCIPDGGSCNKDEECIVTDGVPTYFSGWWATSTPCCKCYN